MAVLVTVTTVPNGSEGLAHIPAGAWEYHVTSPTSEWAVGLGAGTEEATGATRARETSAVATVVVVDATGAGGGGVVMADVVVNVSGVWKSTRCDGSTTASRRDEAYTRCACTRDAAAVTLCACAGPF